MIRYRYLADVVEASAEFEGNKIRAGQAKFSTEANAESYYAFGVTFRFLVPGIECERKRSSGSIPIVSI
jgi:hypothetical protein